MHVFRSKYGGELKWGIWWIEFSGLDGFRVDTYPYNEKQPMADWCAAIVNEYPNFNIVGECWTGNIPQLAYWQGGNALTFCFIGIFSTHYANLIKK